MSGPGAASVRLVEFFVGGERYALPMESVDRVVELHASRDGMGREDGPVTLIAAERLGVAAASPSRWGLVLRRGEGQLVLAVERVEGVREVPARALMDPPARARPEDPVVAGLVRMDEALVVLLNEAEL